jgi:cell shape-determining protein MreC
VGEFGLVTELEVALVELFLDHFALFLVFLLLFCSALLPELEQLVSPVDRVPDTFKCRISRFVDHLTLRNLLASNLRILKLRNQRTFHTFLQLNLLIPPNRLLNKLLDIPKYLHQPFQGSRLLPSFRDSQGIAIAYKDDHLEAVLLGGLWED